MEALDAQAANDYYERYWQAVNHWSSNFTLPYNLQECSLDNLPLSDEKQILQTYDYANDNFGLLLLGKSGVGKTYTMCAFLNRILWECFRVQWPLARCVTYFQIGLLIYKLRDREAGVFDKCINAKFLFLDDLGTENTTDFAREHFFTILDLRCQQRKPTFITSNLTLKELQDKYGERLVSRLKEMCAILELKGPDIRTDIMRDRIQLLKSRKQGSA